MTEKNLNEIDEWWVGFLAEQTERARAHAERERSGVTLTKKKFS